MATVDQIADQLSKTLDTRVEIERTKDWGHGTRYWVHFPDKQLWPCRRWDLGARPHIAASTLAMLADILQWDRAERAAADLEMSEEEYTAIYGWGGQG